MRLNTFNEWTPDQPSRGLGDTVAKFTHKTGIAQAVHKHFPDCRCPERQTFLNKVVPYKKRTMKTLSIITALIALTVQTQAANLNIRYANATNAASRIMLRITPQNPPWVTGGGITLGDPLTVQITNSPFVISNIFGSANTNEAAYLVQMTDKVTTEYYIRVPYTNATLDIESLVIQNPRGLGTVSISLAVADVRYQTKTDFTNAMVNVITNTATNVTLYLVGNDYQYPAILKPKADGWQVISRNLGHGCSFVVGDADSQTNSLYAGFDWSVNAGINFNIGNVDTGSILKISALTNGSFASEGDFNFQDKQTFNNGLQGNGSGLTNLNASAITNAPWQTGSAVLSNGVATGFLTNSAAFQPANSTLTNLAINNAITLTNLSATNIVGTLPMGTLTSSVVTNGFLTSDGSTRSYSKDGQYLTNVTAASLGGYTTNGVVIYGRRHYAITDFWPQTQIALVGAAGWGAPMFQMLSNSSTALFLPLRNEDMIGTGTNCIIDLEIYTTNNAVVGPLRIRTYSTDTTGMQVGADGGGPKAFSSGWASDACTVAPAGTNFWHLRLTGTVNTATSPTNITAAIGITPNGTKTNIWFRRATVEFR